MWLASSASKTERRSMSVLINSSTLPGLALSSSAGFLLAGASVVFAFNLVGGVGRYFPAAIRGCVWRVPLGCCTPACSCHLQYLSLSFFALFLFCPSLFMLCNCISISLRAVGKCGWGREKVPNADETSGTCPAFFFFYNYFS